MTATTIQSQATGLVGFLCEMSGEAVSLDACLLCSRSAEHCSMFPAAIERILATQRPQDYAVQIAAQHGGADHAFSVTEVVYCPRRYRLAREHPYYERPTALWRMLRGTAIHDFLAESPQGIREQTLVWRFRFQGKVVALVGTPDLLMETEHGWVVVDYKFTDFAPRDGKPHNGHESQVLLYCLLVEKAMRSRAAGGQVIYLTKKPLKVDVRYEREAALDLLTRRLSVLLSPDLPAPLTNEQELWQCDYCPLREPCEILHGEPVGKSR